MRGQGVAVRLVAAVAVVATVGGHMVGQTTGCGPSATVSAACPSTEAIAIIDTINKVTSADDCCALCSNNPLCEIWVWYWSEQSGRTINADTCYLGSSPTVVLRSPTKCSYGNYTAHKPAVYPRPPQPPVSCTDPAQAKPKEPTASKYPTVVHIVADDLGYNDLGYVNRVSTTPWIDHLRGCGVHLDQYHTFKMCGPSRGAMLTGRYPFHFGVYSNQDINSNGIPANFTYTPEILKAGAGYMTHAVGKWHNGFRQKEMTPTFRGFDTFYGYWHCCSDYWTHSFTAGNIDQTNATGENLVPDYGQQGVYSAFLYAQEASRIIAAHDAAKPLYIYLPFESVHGPIEAPENYIEMYANSINDTHRRTFSGMLTAMDDAVGHVVGALQAKGLWDNTLLVFASDNGGPLGSANNFPLRGGKFTLWDGGVRVVGWLGGPLLYSHKGTRFTGLAHSSDLMPTILEAVGVPMPDLSHDAAPVDGVSLWQAITQNLTSPRTEVVHQILNQYNLRDCSDDSQNCGAAIRVGKYKLIAGYPGDARWVPLPHLAAPPDPTAACNVSTGEGDCPCWHGYCLFDLEADPNEHTDLSQQLPAVVEQLRTRLETVSKTGTQGCHLCAAETAVDTAALKAELNRTKAYLPYRDFEPWLNDAAAPSCYNPAPGTA